MTLKCEHCGKFTPPRRHGGEAKKYCSIRCARDARYKRWRADNPLKLGPTIVCAICKKTAPRRGKNDRYCSMACQKRSRSPNLHRRCPTCGDPLGRWRQKFCSRKCQIEFHKPPPLPPVPCAWCGEPFQRASRPGGSKARQCCSRECNRKLRTEQWRDYQREYTKRWRKENAEKIRLEKIAWRLANDARLKKKAALYRKEKRAELAARNREYRRKRYHSDPEYWRRQQELKRKHRERVITNPKGDIQWLQKSRHELGKVRRLLSKGLSQRASESPSRELTPHSNSLR